MYPYFFNDPTALSWAQIALNLAGLIAFVAGAPLIVGISRTRARQPQIRPDEVPQEH